MSATENKKLIQQAFAMWAGGDADAVFKLLADDVQWTVIGSTRVSRSYQSKREFLNLSVALPWRTPQPLDHHPTRLMAYWLLVKSPGSSNSRPSAT